MLSLLLLVAVVGLWARGYWRGDVLATSFDGWTLRLYFNRGVILLHADDVSPDAPAWESFDIESGAVTADAFPGSEFNTRGEYGFRACGLTAGRFHAGSLPVTHVVVVVPLWLVTLLLAAPPVASVAGFRSGRRADFRAQWVRGTLRSGHHVP